MELRAELWWSSVQSFGGAPCRALRGLRREPLAELCVGALVKLSVELLAKLRAELLAKLRAELLAKLLVEPLVELCTELPQSSARNSARASAKYTPYIATLFHSSRYIPASERL